MGFYNDGSAYRAFAETGKKIRMPNIEFPIDVQRRNLRGIRIFKHFEQLLLRRRSYGSLRAYFTHNFTGDKRRDWMILQENLLGIWGNGRWAAYTTAEVFQKVHDFPVIPATIGIVGASGPLAGMKALFGTGSEAYYNRKADWLFDKILSTFTPDVPGLTKGYLDLAMMESVLCDWAGMLKGNFYAGRNIDRMQGRILKVDREKPGFDFKELWDVRQRVFPLETLGEDHGWEGIDKERLKAYKLHKKILRPEDER